MCAVHVEQRTSVLRLEICNRIKGFKIVDKRVNSLGGDGAQQY
jgi:hypothetical protein